MLLLLLLDLLLAMVVRLLLSSACVELISRLLRLLRLFLLLPVQRMRLSMRQHMRQRVAKMLLQCDNRLRLLPNNCGTPKQQVFARPLRNLKLLHSV